MMVEGGCQQFLVDCVPVAARIAEAFERRDLAAGPELGDAVAVLRPGQRQADEPGGGALGCGHGAAQFQHVAGFRQARQPRGQHDGFALVEIRQRVGPGFVEEAGGPVHFEAGDDGGLQLLEQLRHAAGDLLGGADMGEGAPADFRRAGHEEGVGGRADADGEQARAAETLGDGFKQLHLVADGTIGEEHHLAQALGVAGIGIGECCLERGQHLGAAVGLERRHEGAGDVEVFAVGALGGREHHVIGVVKADHVETVVRVEPVERHQEALLRLVHGGAGHGA